MKTFELGFKVEKLNVRYIFIFLILIFFFGIQKKGSNKIKPYLFFSFFLLIYKPDFILSK